MLLLEGSMDFPQAAIYRDDKLDTRFFVLAKVPIIRRDNGKAVMKYVKYRTLKPMANGDVGAALVFMDVELALTPEDELELRKKLVEAVKARRGQNDPRPLEPENIELAKPSISKANVTVEVLAGSVKFFVRIGPDGSAKYAYLEDTELGDRPTEKCLLDAVNAAHWPKPDGGGEAEARYGMELPLMATRPPNDWSSEKVTAALTKHHAAIDQCKSGEGSGGGTFRATMYVGSGGHVLAAGIATPGKDDGDKADCLVDVLTKMKGLPSPGSWPAKVSFGL